MFLLVPLQRFYPGVEIGMALGACLSQIIDIYPKIITLAYYYAMFFFNKYFKNIKFNSDNK